MRVDHLAQLVAITFLSAPSEGCVACMVGCGSTAEFSASFVAERGDSITVSTCHALTCGQAKVVLPSACTDGCWASCQLSSINVDCSVLGDAGGWTMTLRYNALSYESDYAADGDVYSVIVTRTVTGEVLLNALDVVSYDEFDVCGEECSHVSSGPFSPLL